MKKVDVIIIGGGPAGLAAALAAKKAGCEDILILERDTVLGGILKQCIHNGFGLHMFKEELTGPEYAERYINMVVKEGIPFQCGTMVIDISKERVVTAVSKDNGLQQYQAGAIVLAMGCRERPRGAIGISGYRCAGVYTAGTAQRFVNLEGLMPGKRVVILGSGDIGLIMARRMLFMGAEVKACVELQPFSAGLKRNIVQCLDDFEIPLMLSHTVIDIKGRERLEGVTVAQVDEKLAPIKGSEKYIECDTLLLSVGLLPENELSSCAGVELSPITSGAIVDETLETSVSGVFAAGNVLHVHDLVDFVSEEAEQAGENAAKFVLGTLQKSSGKIPVVDGFGVNGALPQFVDPERVSAPVGFMFRPRNVYKNAKVNVYFDDICVESKKHRILAPGEMVSFKLKSEIFKEHKNAKKIEVKIEEVSK